jgi:hypothetical protein
MRDSNARTMASARYCGSALNIFHHTLMISASYPGPDEPAILLVVVDSTQPLI